MSLCVLIVEDEMLLALDLEDIVLAAGHNVAGQASDTAQAIAVAERFGERIDVAIMDVNLARGSSGLETATILRQRWNIPSLFVSGNLDEETREKAMGSSPIGFIGKPYSEREMRSVLSAIASSPRHSRPEEGSDGRHSP